MPKVAKTVHETADGGFLGDTVELRRCQALGMEIRYEVCGTVVAVAEYEPRSKNDPQPWAGGGYRFSSGELIARRTEVSR
jgi:hypothetical protein